MLPALSTATTVSEYVVSDFSPPICVPPGDVVALDGAVGGCVSAAPATGIPTTPARHSSTDAAAGPGHADCATARRSIS
jgi:hypothetical protein